MKRIVSAIALYISCIVIDYLVHYLKSRKKTSSQATTQNSDSYVVSCPTAVKYVYITMFALGIILFFVFFFFKIAWNSNISAGNFQFALIFAGIGLFVVIWASSWKVEVEKTELRIHKLFHRTKSVSVLDIKNVEIGKKQEVTLYDMDGKKLLTIDALSDNYDRFLKTLESYGKLPAACK